ncbi:Hypothetical predicted protein [Octopus vulgaris]|uniref:Uncharacterized protein n=1 Tax=Octopus vulgaris TaxID=6645 RepID=A0AA36F1U2_OCTVU|nr:Hypothetical predicted protein [Octopus vulgaris]
MLGKSVSMVLHYSECIVDIVVLYNYNDVIRCSGGVGGGVGCCRDAITTCCLGDVGIGCGRDTAVCREFSFVVYDVAVFAAASIG